MNAQGTSGGAKRSREAKHEGGLTLFTFTPAQRRAQDGLLQPVIEDAWGAPAGVVWWREKPVIKAVHRRWAQSYKDAGTDAWAAYVDMVLKMAWAQVDYFVPIDFWPYQPPPDTGGGEERRGFKEVVDTQRRVAGVYSPHNLRANKQYALLLAHLIWCPDEIHDAADIIAPPYPWPFVLVKRGEEETFRLERQEDIAHGQWKIAETIERKLFRNAKQARRYGTSTTARDQQERRDVVRQEAARIVCRLYDEFRQSGLAAGDIIAAIKEHSDFTAVCSVPGAEIGTSSRSVRALHKEGRVARGEDVPHAGRPTKR